MNLKLPRWVDDGLKKAAKEEGRTVSDMIAGAVAHFVAEKQCSVTPFVFPQVDDYKDDELSKPRRKSKKLIPGFAAGGLPVEELVHADMASASDGGADPK